MRAHGNFGAGRACVEDPRGFLWEFAAVDTWVVWVRVVPTFRHSLNSFLHGETLRFRRDSVLAFPENPDEARVVGFHCQCAFLASRTQSQDALRMRAGGDRCRFPVWVINSPKHSPGPGEAPRDYICSFAFVCVCVRYRVRRLDALAPLGVDVSQRLRSRARIVHRGRVSRCISLSWLLAIGEELDRAMASVLAFLRDLIEHMMMLLGAQGGEVGQRSVLQAVVMCFECERLISQQNSHLPLPFVGSQSWLAD